MLRLANNGDDSFEQYGETPSLEYLSEIKEINQVHYVGTKDTVVPLELTQKIVTDETLIVPVKGARHDKGYDKIIKQIYDER